MTRETYRIGGLLISLALVVAACTQTPGGTEQAVETEAAEETAAAETEAAEETAAAEEVTLTDFGFEGDIQNLFRENLADPFEESHPGVTVELTGGISEDAIAQIKAAQGASPYDTMLLGQPRYLQAQNEGWIQPLSEDELPNIADIYPNIQEKCSPGAAAWTVETIGVVYNPDLVPAPEQWTDLWNPEYEGQIGMAAPASNAGFLFLVLINKLFGDDEANFETAFTKLAELEPFTVAPNPETLGQLLEREEIGLAVNWSTEAAVTLESGFNVEFTFPAPGAMAQVGCYAVLAETANPELAKEYVNEALGVDFQTAMSQPPYFFAPVNENVEPPAEAGELIPAPDDYDDLVTAEDLEAVLAEREAVTDQFTREFGQ
jgi:putative spermidine/putrescine transport system substrate-binding protein